MNLGWKKFWFVLDGRLLTYYKSKSDYESLSACCGCINLGIASSVRPIQIRGCKGYPLQIVTRSQVYYLRSQEKPILEQWLIAIQEAASSPPSSSALTSWNSCSGSQYFRNSFASQSQWSLNNSSDDITDITERLGNLPDTFYQKRDRGSFASTSSQAPPVIHKYHSFASLQTPVINSFGDLRKRVMLSSHENLRNLQQAEQKVDKGTAMQQSTSLLVLDSSPQAAELRKELTRKLSIGSSRQNSICSNEDGESSIITPKFLLLSAKKKSEGVGVFGDDDSHHYDEIGEFEGVKNYENCDADKFPASGSKTNSIRGDSAEKDSNIYEHIETVDTAMSGPQTGIWEPLNEGNSCSPKRLPHRLSAGSNRNSLVSISELPEDTASMSPSPAKTPNLTSIPEACWKSGVEPYKNYSKTHSEDDLSSSRSESFRSLPCVEKGGNKKRKGKAFGNFFSKVFRKKGKGKSDSQENLQSSMVISGPVDLRSMNMPNTTEIQERIKPSQKPNEPTRSANNAQQVSPTATRTKASPTLPGSRMTINNTIVLDELKQKVVELNLKRTNSNSDKSSDSSPKETLQNNNNNKGRQQGSVEARVPYVPRPGGANNQSRNKSLPVLVFQTQDKSLESSTDDDDFFLNEREKEVQVASISLSPDNETSSSEVDKLSQIGESPSLESPTEELLDTVPTSVPTIRQLPSSSSSTASKGRDTEDFQNKLAKFNRLSQSLNASFMAALAPSNTSTMHSQMGRSHSYKQHRNKGGRNDDILPPLPPKKKNMLCGGTTGSVPTAIYDVPLNNKPVPSKQTSAENIQAEKSIAAYVRSLTKKNSTPDIVLSGNSSKPFFRDMLEDAKARRKSLNNSDDSIDVHKSNASLPPPRPPKPKPPAKPKSLDLNMRTKRNSESSESSETIVSQSPKASQILLDTPPKTSPATSNKSLDIDNLDALSEADLTETKVSNSPQQSPKLCPIHPENSLRADSVISSVAKTPESTVSDSDRFVPDSLASTPDTQIFLDSESQTISGAESDPEPISINKLEIVIRDNDGSPGLTLKSPDNESRIDSLERNTKLNSIISSSADSSGGVYQNLKFATVNTLIQEFETVEENEDEMSELYDDFPSEFYTPTPSSFSGYSPSEASTTSSSDSSPSQIPAADSSPAKKHIRIDSIRNSGMEQLEAFLSFGSNSSSDELSFESCTDSIVDEGAVKPNTSQSTSLVNTSSTGKVSASVAHFNAAASQSASSAGGVNRVGAISRLGHSSAIGHLQKILTSDVK
ncbi:Oxysterol-binding protein C2F12.05c [Orchesella cincta]|uniref:Oxysterol-binding protein C2F12.05c n=1 Tax=Orchesella cincta TaxID=48709 RepID=A0A1D2MTC2_ORCCI|nr:Oxysterol-binding protein C2F12.05c [Orchesella cincta]